MRNRALQQAPGSERPLVERGSAPVLRQGTNGQSVIVRTAVAGTPGEFGIVLDVQGSSDEAEALTLVIAPPTNPDGTRLAGAAQDVDVEVRISTGVHGFVTQTVLDAQNGARLQLAAARIRVEARVTGGAGVPTGTQVRIGASVGVGGSGSSVAQRTLTTGVLGGGATGALDIPVYAKGVTIQPSALDAANGYSIAWLDAAGASIGTVSVPVSSVASTGPGPILENTGFMVGAGRAGFAIPNRARQLAITNGAGGANKFFSAIFELSL